MLVSLYPVSEQVELPVPVSVLVSVQVSLVLTHKHSACSGCPQTPVHGKTVVVRVQVLMLVWLLVVQPVLVLVLVLVPVPLPVSALPVLLLLLGGSYRAVLLIGFHSQSSILQTLCTAVLLLLLTTSYRHGSLPVLLPGVRVVFLLQAEVDP